ncbi:HAMP domain-containing sensor histidine kinase [Hasllibacter sp. MH4015]|uniref:sensor histidine kinase n=1 Tax=Hasllibacter sp. MH4015 TaxID=2854029 RepID=UPI001CD6968C|nr:HAMP domain-containing sensor histidine kinase [Hasllibacter sp. MH4015]
MTKPLIPIVTRAGLALGLSASFSGAVTFDVPAQPLGDVAAGAVAAAAFYLCTFSVLAVLMAIALSLRHGTWALYTLLVLLGLIYVGLFEQNITGIVWSGIDIGPHSLIACGYAMLSINYLVASNTLPADHRWGWLKRPFAVAAIGIWGIWAIGRTGSLEFAHLLFSVTGCTVAIAHFFPVSTFTKLRGGYDRIIRNLIWVLLTGVLIGGTVVVAGAFDGQDLTVAINRFLIAAITIGFGALFIRNIFVLQSDREIAVQEALDRAIEQARISQELLEAQDNHKAAVDLARARTLRLATASHDIRQPLSSLRTSFSVLARDMPADTRDHLRDSLDYLDELASSYMSEATDEAADPIALAERERLDTEADHNVRAEQIGQTLQRMFEDDAAKRNLVLDLDVAPAGLHTQPLALMRVLCNVVSNAIAHGAPGTLSVSGAAAADGYTFRIRNPGAGVLDFDPWSKGDGSDGTGLGLAIVREQAARAGVEVSAPDCADDETCVVIRVPTAKAGDAP